VGNNAYQGVPKLEKAINGAKAVSSSLQEIGFQVQLATDLTYPHGTECVFMGSEAVLRKDLQWTKSFRWTAPTKVPSRSPIPYAATPCRTEEMMEPLVNTSKLESSK
jgi:hypothetical protein